MLLSLLLVLSIIAWHRLASKSLSLICLQGDVMHLVRRPSKSLESAFSTAPLVTIGVSGAVEMPYLYLRLALHSLPLLSNCPYINISTLHLVVPLLHQVYSKQCPHNRKLLFFLSKVTLVWAVLVWVLAISKWVLASHAQCLVRWPILTCYLVRHVYLVSI